MILGPDGNFKSLSNSSKLLQILHDLYISVKYTKVTKCYNWLDINKVKNSEKKSKPLPGIEPGSPACRAVVLTTKLRRPPRSSLNL